MLVDTHTHLQFDAFAGDLAEVLARAREAGVGRVVVCGTELANSRQAVALAAQWPGLVAATVGVHPSEAASLDAAVLAELRELAQRPEVVAIGEIGLDFYRDYCPRELQRAAFRAQQELALELGLPMVIHARGALAETYELLRAGGGFRTRVVMHCFLDEPEAAEQFVAAGCWLGTDGPITYPKAEAAREVVRRTPLERLLVETDCPYLAPQGWRGKRCEPAQVRAVAEMVAAVRGTTFEEVAAVTTAAAAQVFAWSDV